MTLGRAPLALLLLLAACDGAGEAPSWFPLAEGMRWHYRTEMPRRRQTIDSVYRVLGPRTLAQVGRSGIAVEETRSTVPTMWSGPGEVELSLWVSDGEWMDRIYLQYDGAELVPQIGFEDRRALPVRFRPALTWQSETASVRDRRGAGYAHRHRLSAELHAVTVPAGTFRGCLRLDTESVIPATAPGRQEIVYFYREWYAPRVGLVRGESWSGRVEREERSRTELLDYELPAGAPR